MIKHFFFTITIILFSSASILAQEEKKPDWRKLHYLSEEEMHTPIQRDINFTETPPPEGDVRMVAEFEPMQSVLIRYPFGITLASIAEMAKDLHVVTIVSSSSQATTVQNQYANNGINTENCSFLIANNDSYWVRDFGPWFIFDGDKQPGIVDFVYNRSRPNDNLIPEKVAAHLDVNLYGMNLVHCGGNMMVDGRGMGASTDLVYQENSNFTQAEIHQKVQDYLGVARYDCTIDPLNEYIKHIDCWGKYLAPDKILIAQLPQTDPRYQDYEDVANFFATTNCSYGYPYKVYRVFESGNYLVTPYTNSIILNSKVLVPVTGTPYDEAALEVYQEAMPGYTIVPVTGTWENTDAMHCRSIGIADLGMLFIDHQPLFGIQNNLDSLAITSKIIAYSGENLVSDSLLIYYSINDGTYQTARMSETGTDEFTGYIKGFDSEDEISYYIFAKDESGRRMTQPYMNKLDPHQFSIEYEENEPFLTMSHDTLWFETTIKTQSFFIGNETTSAITINGIEEQATTKYLEISLIEGANITPIELMLPLTIQPSETIEIQASVNIEIPVKEYIANDINIQTDWEIATVVAMINEDIISLSESNITASCKIYPNPFEEKVYFDFTLESSEIVTIELFTVQGQSVAHIQRQLHSGDHSINLDMSNFNQNIYFCRVTLGNKTTYSKLVHR